MRQYQGQIILLGPLNASLEAAGIFNYLTLRLAQLSEDWCSGALPHVTADWLQSQTSLNCQFTENPKIRQGSASPPVNHKPLWNDSLNPLLRSLEKVCKFDN